VSEHTVADLFAAGLDRHLALAGTLSEADGAVPTAACPLWTVKDVYSHLAGLCADILDGRTDGAATDPWTARQVAERADRSLADNVAELAAKGPAIVEVLRTFPVERVVVDQWTHEQDVRGALGRPGSRDVPAVAWALDLVAGPIGEQRTARGEPALRVDGSSGTWVLGDGDPEATIRADDFDLLRAYLGRRSAEQVGGWLVDGDPSAVGTVALFGPRTDPLVE